MELTERQKGLLTLICDKLNWYGEMCGATDNKNWRSQIYYTHNPEAEQPQWTMDRIGKVIYNKTMLVDDEKHDFGNPCYLGPEFYHHSIRFEWRELFGKGWGPNPPECMLKPYCSLLQDEVGNWHSPKDTGIWITLWHPSEQNGLGCGEGQEKIFGSNKLGNNSPRWRPTYNYTDDEVREALKIMAETFGWEYEDGGMSHIMIMRHAEEE